MGKVNKGLYKNNQKESPASKKNEKTTQKKSGLISYIKGVRKEMSKVVWLSKDELSLDTIVVFACVIFFAASFWAIDTGFLAGLKGILGITL